MLRPYNAPTNILFRRTMLIIGENINATIPRIKELIVNHDGTALEDLAVKQEQAGANIIDVNVATGVGTAEDEINDMKWLIELVMDKVEMKLCVDSADTPVLRAGLEAGGEKTAEIALERAWDGADMVYMSFDIDVPPPAAPLIAGVFSAAGCLVFNFPVLKYIEVSA